MLVVSQCEDIIVIMVLVMQIMPELQDLGGEPSPSPPLFMVHVQVGSIGTLKVAFTPSLVDLNLSLDFTDHVVKVNEAGSLAPNSETLFAKELFNILINFGGG
jgi:hypothetical protein